MLLSFFENNVTSRTKISIIALVIGLSSTLGGCSVVMSPDNETVVGAVADYTPFEMDDDDSIFGNKQARKPAFAQKMRTETSFNQQMPIQAAPIQADSPSSSQQIETASAPSPSSAIVKPSPTTTTAMVTSNSAPPLSQSSKTAVAAINNGEKTPEPLRRIVEAVNMTP